MRTKRPQAIPTGAGVYIFRRRQTPLYIGKAANLRSRVGSYFTKAAGRTSKVERMLEEATRLEIIETPSEVEALIKEAELIKKYRPKYNLLMRDDKSYFYVGTTRETFPRIFVGHQPKQQALGTRDQALGRRRKLVPSAYRLVPRYIGPFTSGSALRVALKLLRRVFPYCTCKQPHRRPCLNSEIGRCVGYCCTITEGQKSKVKSQKLRAEYRKNIRNIVAVLSGERTRLIGRLRHEMKEAVKKERYEEAARLRDAIFGLEDVFAHRQVLHTPEARYPWLIVLGKLQSLLKTKRDISRIEGYDISNISGTGATGSMVVFTPLDARAKGAAVAKGDLRLTGFTNGYTPDKSQYRKFRIRTVRGSNDVAMLKEVLRRRLTHEEWPYPELMVIDGGKPQLSAAMAALRESRIWNLEPRRPIVSALAKREEILFTADGRAIPLQRQDPALLHLFQRIRDESHRFARAYHHKLRESHFALSAKSQIINRP